MPEPEHSFPSGSPPPRAPQPPLIEAEPDEPKTAPDAVRLETLGPAERRLVLALLAAAGRGQADEPGRPASHVQSPEGIR